MYLYLIKLYYYTGCYEIMTEYFKFYKVKEWHEEDDDTSVSFSGKQDTLINCI